MLLRLHLMLLLLCCVVLCCVVLCCVVLSCVAFCCILLCCIVLFCVVICCVVLEKLIVALQSNLRLIHLGSSPEKPWVTCLQVRQLFRLEPILLLSNLCVHMFLQNKLQLVNLWGVAKLTQRPPLSPGGYPGGLCMKYSNIYKCEKCIFGYGPVCKGVKLGRGG